MAKKATYPSAKRFGTRYGRTMREKVGKIEAQQRKNHECPYCNYKSVKRENVGIWKCNKCGSVFTSKAYTVSKVKHVKPLQEEAAENNAEA
jgi:large subunit ribosomal protein L37Ae